MDEKIEWPVAVEMLKSAGYTVVKEENRLAIHKHDALMPTYCYFYNGPPGGLFKLVSSQAVKRLVNKAYGKLPKAAPVIDHKVRPIRADVVQSEGKQHLLDTIAQAFDALAADGSEPVAVVFALVTESGGVRTGYRTLSCIDGRNALHVSRGVTCLITDHIAWDKGFTT